MDVQDSEGGAQEEVKPDKSSKKVAGKAGSKAAASKAEKAAEQQRQAQLELLMMDDSALQDVARLGGVPACLPPPHRNLHALLAARALPVPSFCVPA